MAVKEAAPRYRRINLPSLDELFLGWTKGLDTSRNFCWRQLRDMKGPALVELIAPITLVYYARRETRRGTTPGPGTRCDGRVPRRRERR